MRARRSVALVTLCGTVVLAGWAAVRLTGFGSSGIENTDAAPIENRGAPPRATSVSAADERVDAPQATAMGGVSIVHVATAVLELPAPAVVPAAASVADVTTADPNPSEPTAAPAGPSVADVATADPKPAELAVPAAAPVADVATADPVPPTSALVPAAAPVADVATADPKPAEPAVVPAAASVADVATADPVPPTSALVPAATSDGEVATADPEPPAFVLAAASAAHLARVRAALPSLRPTPPPETPPVQVASLTTDDPVQGYANKPVSSEILNECLVADICIDEYLWSLYERTPKVDTNKVVERIKVTVKKKGKTRTITKSITKYVVGDFTWKDPIAAKRADMSLKDYVIGGMDRSFRLKLYRALRAMDDAGLMPGITSAFRDDYRQAIATGNKAASDSSYHGGSRRGGYGHGLAADLVSVRGGTRMERFRSSEELWKWIDGHEKELGIGRPYLDRDPPHVGPIDGKEYVAKRGRGNVKRAGLRTKNAQRAGSRAKTAQKVEPRAKIAQKAGPQTKTAQKVEPRTKTAQKAAPQTKTAQKARPLANTTQKPTLETKKRPLTLRNDPGPSKRAQPAKTSKVSTLQNRASVQR